MTKLKSQNASTGNNSAFPDYSVKHNQGMGKGQEEFSVEMFGCVSVGNSIWGLT